MGATGMVGQRFIQLLERHPWFEVAWMAASERSFGKTYAEAAKWKMKTPIPTRIASMVVSAAEPKDAPKVIFAALDADLAREMEPAFADAGCAVISNSSAFRMHPQVPLVIPEINADHIKLIESAVLAQAVRRLHGHQLQLLRHGTRPCARSLAEGIRHRGCLCRHHAGRSAARAIPASPRWTSSATSCPALRMKKRRCRKRPANSLANSKAGEIVPADFAISAHCNRVAVEDGHTESISIKLKKQCDPGEDHRRLARVSRHGRRSQAPLLPGRSDLLR